MARVGIVFGILLCVLAFIGLCGCPSRLPTQFVPMMFGIPIFFCGVIGLNPHRRRLSMNSALAIGVTGLVSGSTRAVYSGLILGTADSNSQYALKMITATAVLCLMFVVAWGISFLATRRRRGK